MKILMNKKEARTYARNIIKNLSEKDKEKRVEELFELLSKNEEFLKAKKVAIYHPLNHELNILKLMEIYNDKIFYFPKTKKAYMDFREVHDLSRLIDGKFDLKEPDENMPVEFNIDVYLVPCMASAKNYRIGHGAGYYDRYFSLHNGYKIGIVFSELKDLNVEVDSHDIPMDLIL